MKAKKRILIKDYTGFAHSTVLESINKYWCRFAYGSNEENNNSISVNTDEGDILLESFWGSKCITIKASAITKGSAHLINEASKMEGQNV